MLMHSRDTGTSLSSPQDLRSLLAPGEHIAGVRIVADVEGCIEIEREGAFVILLWPAVWQQPGRLAPHLSRARSGGHGLLLFDVFKAPVLISCS